MKLPKPAKGPIYLPIETTARELDGKLLLAAEAVSRGYAAIIGSKGSTLNVAERVRQGIWLDKGHADYDIEARFKRLSDANIHCTAIDEEGLVFANDETYLKNRGIKSGAALSYLSSVFVWGHHQKSILERFNTAKEKLVVTGNPRFDIVQPKFRDFFSREVGEIKRTHNNYLLINTNFAVGNRAFFYKNSYLDEKKDLGIINSQDDLEFFKGWQAYKQTLFQKYCEMVRSLAAKMPEVNVIVRPHPSEECTTWKHELDDFSNIHVCREGNVINWILGSRAVIHSGCTTGIEAFVAGVPVLRYHPLYDERYESPLSNSLGDSAADLETLIEKARQIVQGYSKEGAHKYDILKKHLENIEGSWAYENILNEFDRLSDSGSMQGSISDIQCPSFSSSLIRNARRKMSYTHSSLKNIFVQKTHKNQKFINLKVAEVADKIRLIMTILEGKKDHQVSQKYVIKKIDENNIGIFPA